MDISKYIYKECFDPVKVKVYNGIKNVYEERFVPCGKCYHCKITRINEWVTRMVVQSNYSKFVYFGTLTYSGKRESIYNEECLSILSNFNETRRYCSTPLVLRKDHLQKFFKRLRKNTNIKFQYACCGEYGHDYSRPHFHYIIWSNDPISILQVYKAWTAPSVKDITKKVVIGKVEHRDIKNNPDPRYNDPDGTWAYKYVCKYIQKFDFKFEELTNYKQHKINYAKEFKYIHSVSANEDFYLGKRLDDYLKSKGIKNFRDYKKVFSPFFHCSKKPAIGFQYLQDNIGRFQKADFRLFGLSRKYIFPLYFVRKTKESICPLKAQSEVNEGTTSYSRLPKMESLLADIINAERIAESTDQIIRLFQCEDDFYTLESNRRIQDISEYRDERDRQPVRNRLFKFKRCYLSFTNHETHVRYSFIGDCFALYNSKNEYVGSESLENVLLLIKYYYERLKRKILIPLAMASEVSANQKNALIEDYGGIEKFTLDKGQLIKEFNSKVDKKQKIYKQSKKFE